MSPAQPILITIPSFVSTNRSANTTPVVRYNSTITGNKSNETSNRGKKRRLDHLSWEEKILRKKLKNRVAAQTSRDRKKAKMDEMENSLKLLTDQNKDLLTECQTLRNLNEKLLKENAELRKQLTYMSSKQSSGDKSQVCIVDCDSTNISGPAVSKEYPQQQGSMKSQLAVTTTAASLLQVMMACLLLKTSPNSLIQNSTLINSRNLHKVYSKISLANLKQIIKEKILNGELQLPMKNRTQQQMKTDCWWGPHQNSWNPVDLRA